MIRVLLEPVDPFRTIADSECTMSCVSLICHFALGTSRTHGCCCSVACLHTILSLAPFSVSTCTKILLTHAFHRGYCAAFSKISAPLRCIKQPQSTYPDIPNGSPQASSSNAHFLGPVPAARLSFLKDPLSLSSFLPPLCRPRVSVKVQTTKQQAED